MIVSASVMPDASLAREKIAETVATLPRVQSKTAQDYILKETFANCPRCANGVTALARD